MKVLVDMNLSPRWVDLLSGAGFEAAHWSTVGEPDAPDVEILALAAANGFVVLTNDLDFSAILAATRGHKPSVVQVRSDNLSPSNIGPQEVVA
jgi:predicted nuclease of predicted toxin-antitoxin system